MFTAIDQHPASHTPDDDVFVHLAKVYARTHPTMHKGLPCPGHEKGFKNGIVNGATWYTLTGKVDRGTVYIAHIHCTQHIQNSYKHLQ